ncbi:MAG: ATP-binding protein [Bacteroidales bacterium]|nr:ATP-binding protein [Bacteroidales bacterium]
MIERILLETIRQRGPSDKAIIILGSRQVGKTTLLQELTKERQDKLVLNGDEPDIRELMSNPNSERLKSIFAGKTLIIIDEAQMIPNIGITLKLITDRIQGIHLYVTGSSSLELANTINEPLTGRKLEFHIHPLSLGEMIQHNGLLKERRLLPQRLVFGYYPEVVTSAGQEVALLKELASSYLYKDILSFGIIKKPVVLDKLLRVLALQLGCEVSYNELAQLVGVDKETVERYIDLLEKAFIIYKLNSLSRNVRNEIKKGKKVYFWDNGIRNAIIGNFLPWENRTDQGALWENFIIGERMKHLSYQNFYGQTYFWRTSQQQEIDLIEEKDGAFNVYEFKVNPRKTSKIPLTFSKAYPVNKFMTIHPANIEEILK